MAYVHYVSRIQINQPIVYDRFQLRLVAGVWQQREKMGQDAVILFVIGQGA